MTIPSAHDAVIIPRASTHRVLTREATPPALAEVAEPCTLRSAGGRVRDGVLRQAGPAAAVVAGVGGLVLGQEVMLVLPRRGLLRLRGQVAGIGVMGLLLDLRAPDCGPDWRQALRAMTGDGCAFA